MYDVVIIGAGPAGATLAARLDKKLKVLILDKRSLDKPSGGIVKCCGGLLAPDAQQMLAHLGRGIPKDILTGPQLFTVRTIDLDNDLERYYQRHYINVDRERLDRWFNTFIPDHVRRVYDAHFKNFKRVKDGYILKYTQYGKVYEVEAQMIVGADGAFSTVRKQLEKHHPHKQPEVYASIEEWFKVSQTTPYFTTIFDREVTDFYSWTIPKGDYLILGSAIPKGQEINKKFKLLKSKLTKRGYELEECSKRQGAIINRPMHLNQISIGQENVFLIGEAAGFISPSSAEGFSYAFRSSLALAKSINGRREDIEKEYHHYLKKLYANILFKNLKAPFMYNKLLRKIVMTTGVLSMDIDD
ncbi:FAD-binding protein [Vallitalea okinawensis]|uniref:FAD-binding protein n=1 Tax=Vallitalea okinawensis TaxID=2078660 RepID=UPI000CFDEC47|nr:FAD-binding protein [Vallitalea okinawensis]